MEMFANRLLKNARHLRKWARKRDISCYRLYDRDIPEFPLIVDYYEGRVHLQSLYESDISPEIIIEAVSSVLEVPRVSVKLKRREGQKEGQYAKTGEKGEDFVVSEGGHKFIVNLDAYLDTGLFLDHRITRQMVGQRSENRKFLNLFAYTGSFTVYAACGGASATTTVDMSNTYLEWARRNFIANNINTSKNKIIRDDVNVFLEKCKETYDLIVLDPPTFSNSKKMSGNFDVQRDHAILIKKCMALLSGGGELFFSNNLRSFKLDTEIPVSFECREISAMTVPEDFRNKKVHRCWLLRKP